MSGDKGTPEQIVEGLKETSDYLRANNKSVAIWVDWGVDLIESLQQQVAELEKKIKIEAIFKGSRLKLIGKQQDKISALKAELSALRAENEKMRELLAGAVETENDFMSLWDQKVTQILSTPPPEEA